MGSLTPAIGRTK